MTAVKPKRTAKKLTATTEGEYFPPIKTTLLQAQALQSVAAGKADEQQQIIALQWVVNEAAAAYKNVFIPNSDVTQFNAGRAFVGQSITRLINTPLTNWSDT